MAKYKLGDCLYFTKERNVGKVIEVYDDNEYPCYKVRVVGKTGVKAHLFAEHQMDCKLFSKKTYAHIYSCAKVAQKEIENYINKGINERVS